MMAMTIHKKPSCKYNVFIFNNIINNQEDIKLLTKTFKNLNCRIKTYQSLTIAEYEDAIKEICTANFGVYDYIAIIVLDNTNCYKHILKKTGDEELRINNDLLVRILQNETLLHKKRLYIIQTNQITSDEAPGPSKVHRKYPPKYDADGKEIIDKNKEIVIYAGTTIYLYGTGPECELGPHWPVPNAPPSPFIDSFCRNLSQYAGHREIQYVYDRICKDLENQDFIPYMTLNPKVIFGKALTEDEIENFFPELNSTSSDSD